MSFNGKILIVDDEAHIRKFLSLLVKQVGQPQIFEASNGIEAVETYCNERPDLVFMDVNLPGLDGMGALKEIMAADPDALVVMLTSLTNRQMVQQALELGAANYIRKDTPKEEILASIKELIQDCFES